MPPPKIQKGDLLRPPLDLKAWPKKASDFKASPAWPLRPLLASFGLPGLAFLRPDVALLGDFGLTWPRLACLGLPWPCLASFRALACPAVGLPTLPLYWPCPHFRGVRLARPRLEKGSDKGLQGRLCHRIWYPLASL